jgi:hypothetical protein
LPEGEGLLSGLAAGALGLLGPGPFGERGCLAFPIPLKLLVFSDQGQQFLSVQGDGVFRGLIL